MNEEEDDNEKGDCEDFIERDSETSMKTTSRDIIKVSFAQFRILNFS